MGNKIMPAIYITGVAGTGKTSILNEFSKRGAIICDTDSICYWVDNNGENVEYEFGIGRKWLESHKYVCPTEKLKSILELNNDKLVVVAGIADNQENYFSWFKKIFILTCEKKVLRDRLINRKTNEFAKEVSEREYVLDWQLQYEKEMIEKGAIPINTEGNIESTVDEIMSYL